MPFFPRRWQAKESPALFESGEIRDLADGVPFREIAGEKINDTYLVGKKNEENGPQSKKTT